ncbi:MAG: hypothetical protein AAGI48_08855 [Verrucomicrobiota bacterium]
MIPILAEEPEFGAIADDYAAKAKIVERLDKVILRDVQIDGLSIEEAVHQLQGLGSADGSHGGVINLIIRGRREPRESAPIEADPDDPFTPSAEEPVEPEPPKQPAKIKLRSDSISFAKAIDRVCTQAGYRWAVGGDRKRYPTLILTPNQE